MRSLLIAVFKNDTRWRLKSLCITIALLLFYECTPKPSSYFPASTGRVINEEHARAQSTPQAREDPIANLPAENVLVDSVSFAAEAGGKDTTYIATISILPKAEILKLQTRGAEKSLTNKQVNAAQFHKAAKKKRISKTSERVVHPLSWLSFGLSMAGLVLLIITLAAGPLLPFVLSLLSFLAAIITSRKATSEIKKNPEQFSGKALARAGFIVSLIMLLVYVVFILYVLAFAGAF
jgi:hypothetical protein